jgi:hypothetical protein
MHLFTLAEKMRLWMKLHPDMQSSCESCPINRRDEGFSADICNDLIAIFQKRYNMPTTTKIYDLCPVPFMEREDFGE